MSPACDDPVGRADRGEPLRDDLPDSLTQGEYVSNRRWFAVAAAAAIVVATLVVVVPHASDAVAVPVDDLAELIAPLLAAAACWLTASRLHGRARAGWIIVGAGAAIWAAGQSAWTWQELVQGQLNPLPSLADAGFIAAVPILLLGLFTMPVWPSGSAAKVRAVSDGLLTAGGLLLVSWHTVLAPVVASPASTPFAQAIRLASPIWVAGYLLVALAALYALGRSVDRVRTVPRWRSAALPYLAVPAAIAFALQERVADGSISMFTLITGIAVFLLVLVRQELAVHENIGLLRRLEANETTLHDRAEHDPLTDLANRAAFIRRVDAALRQPSLARLAAVMFVDLDDFKQVNDSLGHSVGDQAIVAVGRRLQSCMRDGDLVARLGGDEFAIFLTRLPDVGHMVAIAERFIDALNQPFESADMRASVCGTIGIAIAEEGDDAAELLRRADIAMYAAKARGKGLFGIFEPSMQVAMYAPLERGAGLRHALETGEFTLYFQPVVDVATRAMTGVEALLRWRHPRLGILPPADFLPDLENAGLMVPVGRWVVEEACRQAVRLRHSTGADLFVSVNVSSSQLHDGGFVAIVTEALAASGLPARALVTELTESGSVGDSEQVAVQLRQLRDLGVRMAIDDFGSGYSSFMYLRRLRVDILKIEKTFVDDLLCGGPKAALVEAMIRLGISLGLVTVAEGVEEEAQHAALVRLGCTSAQGYLHARPMPMEQLLVAVAGWPMAGGERAGAAREAAAAG
jgi:diguanylate cyclase (GGDEF)-like protein